MLISKTITSALRKIGVTTGQDEANTYDLQLGLETLNRIIDSYNTNGLIIGHLETISVSEPQSGWKSVLSIGSGKDIDVQDVSKIKNVFFSDNGKNYNMTMMSFQDFIMSSPQTSTGIPTQFLIRDKYSTEKKIMFNRTPQSGLLLNLSIRRKYTGVNGDGNEYIPTDNIIWDDGFEKMLMYRLALELCPDFGVNPSNLVISLAQEAEESVKRSNVTYETLQLDTSLVRRGRNVKIR